MEYDLDELLSIANENVRHCYAPYSKIRVVAVLLTDRGVYVGVNIENASYGLTICAERVAIFKSVSEGVRKFKKMLIYSPDVTPIPCGACLQVLSEFADENFEILIASVGSRGETLVKSYRLRDLLPLRFNIRKDNP